MSNFLKLKIMNSQFLVQLTQQEFMDCLVKTLVPLLQKNDSSTQQEKDHYTREETAKLLNVSYATLHNWNRSGILQCKKIGKRVYYSRAVIDSKLQNT